MDTKIDALVSHSHRHPRVFALVAIVALGSPWVLDNYRKFLALGNSRLTPLGPLGWLIALSLTGLGREAVSTAEYDEDTKQESWLERPVERRGARPTMGWHCVPHRQLDRLPTDDVAKRLEAIFEKRAAANPSLVQIVPSSPHEKLNPGMIIHPDIPSPHKEADQALREIAHVHSTDHSLHLMLSPADCKTVIELGWAERHPLSGVSRFLPIPSGCLPPSGFLLPSGYLMVYAPRNEEELDVVERIIVASMGYMTGSHSIA